MNAFALLALCLEIPLVTDGFSPQGISKVPFFYVFQYGMLNQQYSFQ